MKEYFFIGGLKRFIISVYAVLILLVAPTIIHSQEIQVSDNPFAGKDVFVEKNCVACHSIYGMGGHVGRDLGKIQFMQGPMGIIAIMWNHSPDMGKLMEGLQDMPVFSETEMEDLVTFIYFLKYLDVPGNAEKGSMLLSQKACLTCHTLEGMKSEKKILLGSVNIYANPLSFMQNMWNKGVQMSVAVSDRGLQWPAFSGEETVDLFAYLIEMSLYRKEAPAYLMPGRPQPGEKIFEAKGCTKCHKIGAQGIAVGPDLAQANFYLGATQIAQRFLNAGPVIWKKMEAMNIKPPVFQENEMADLLAYLYSLSFKKQTADPDTGKLLFAKKGCRQCHSVRGRGGNVGPDLGKASSSLNLMNATAALWNCNRTMRILMKKVGVPMPRFNEDEINDLFHYIHSERLKHEEE